MIAPLAVIVASVGMSWPESLWFRLHWRMQVYGTWPALVESTSNFGAIADLSLTTISACRSLRAVLLGSRLSWAIRARRASPTSTRRVSASFATPLATFPSLDTQADAQPMGSDSASRY